MHLNEMTALQDDFDRKHGWTIKTADLSELIEMLHRDVVGLIGEVGEFANILKKVALIQHYATNCEATNAFEYSKNQLSEELIDALIYMLRMAAYLNIDLEKEYLIKLEFNKQRYKKYEA